MEFNNQHHIDEVHTKLLLMLPMVPKREHEKIGLNFLRLVPAESEREIGATREKRGRGGGLREPVPGSGEIDEGNNNGFEMVGVDSEI